MPPGQRSGIEAVVIDMGEPYINRVKRGCPDAKRVFDLFHVVKEFNKSIDKVRNREYRMAREHDERVLKGTRYLLLKNEENLRPEEASRLQDLLERNKNPETMYILKDCLKESWNHTRRDHAREAPADWCRIADESGIGEAKSFAKRLLRCCDGILHHCEYPISAGRLEGCNNKIKVIKRRAYGFPRR